MIDILSQNYPCKGLDKRFFQRKIVNIFYPSVLTYILGAQKPRLIGPVDLRTHNICFG